jgi:uncharacterized protein
MTQSFKFLRFSAIFLVALYLIAFAFVYFNQRSMVFNPNTAASTPQQAGLAAFEAVPTGNGLTSWWHAPKAKDAPIILYFHGNGGSLAGRTPIFAEMASWGAGVLAVGYPGYGGNPGDASEEAIHRAAQANYDWLIKQGIDSRRIVITAHSMGTGVAVPLAAKNQAAGVILESPFTSLATLAQRQMWMFPVKHLVKDPFRNTDTISRIKMPVVWMHGTADHEIPYAMGAQLYAMVAAPKCHLRIEGGDHNHLWDMGVKAFTQRQAFAMVKTGDCDGTPVLLKDGQLFPG